MYDLNITVPNITDNEYSQNEKFKLIKDYFFELNEALNIALNKSVVPSTENTEATISNGNAIKNLNVLLNARLTLIRDEILRTAQELKSDYDAKIEASTGHSPEEATAKFVNKDIFSQELSANENEHLKLKSQIDADEMLLKTAFLSKDEGNSDFNFLKENFNQSYENLRSSLNESALRNANAVEKSKSVLSSHIFDEDFYIKEIKNGDFNKGVKIGKSDGSQWVEIFDNSISFYHMNKKIAVFKNNELYVEKLRATEGATLGNGNSGRFSLDVTSNGLEVSWINE